MMSDEKRMYKKYGSIGTHYFSKNTAISFRKDVLPVDIYFRFIYKQAFFVSCLSYFYGQMSARYIVAIYENDVIFSLCHCRLPQNCTMEVLHSRRRNCRFISTDILSLPYTSWSKVFQKQFAGQEEGVLSAAIHYEAW